jgi:hypothetical protein
MDSLEEEGEEGEDRLRVDLWGVEELGELVYVLGVGGLGQVMGDGGTLVQGFGIGEVEILT